MRKPCIVLIFVVKMEMIGSDCLDQLFRAILGYEDEFFCTQTFFWVHENKGYYCVEFSLGSGGCLFTFIRDVYFT